MKDWKKLKFSDAYDQLCRTYYGKYKQPEEWRPVVYDNCTTKYMVSNYGRIFDTMKIKIPPISIHQGHFQATIELDDGRHVRVGTYRLVALAFIPVPQKYFDAGYTIAELVVDHMRDGDEDNRDDNTVWNLQWLTHRENISKAANCGVRPMYSHDFRERLDKMILDGYDNKEIYDMCENEYGYSKQEMKAQVQVRRRRLGMTLRDHYERDPEFVAEVDKLINEGYTNDEIIREFNMPEERYANATKSSKNSSRRFLDYRRSVLNKPANVSKYFTNEQNDMLNELIEQGLSNDDIINQLGLADHPCLDKIKASISTRKSQYKRRLEK